GERRRFNARIRSSSVMPGRHSGQPARPTATPVIGSPSVCTLTVLPSAETAAMLFWALLASGQINMRKVDGWQTLATKPIDQPIDLAACPDTLEMPEIASPNSNTTRDGTSSYSTKV